jgi:hypothetical protein
VASFAAGAPSTQDIRLASIHIMAEARGVDYRETDLSGVVSLGGSSAVSLSTSAAIAPPTTIMATGGATPPKSKAGYKTARLAYHTWGKGRLGGQCWGVVRQSPMCL